MAMIDGIQNKTTPGSALDKPLNSVADVMMVSIGRDENGQASRRQLMESLISDSDFLSRGQVFSNELIDVLCRQLG